MTHLGLHAAVGPMNTYITKNAQYEQTEQEIRMWMFSV